MTSRRSSTNSRKTTGTPEPHEGRGRSQDRARQYEDAQHHEESHPRSHPPHHVMHQPAGLPKHHPHTRPTEEALNIDHGAHEDRPRPGKLMKKESPGKKARP